MIQETNKNAVNIMTRVHFSYNLNLLTIRCKVISENQIEIDVKKLKSNAFILQTQCVRRFGVGYENIKETNV